MGEEQIEEVHLKLPSEMLEPIKRLAERANVSVEHAIQLLIALNIREQKEPK